MANFEAAFIVVSANEEFWIQGLDQKNYRDIVQLKKVNHTRCISKVLQNNGAD